MLNDVLGMLLNIIWIAIGLFTLGSCIIIWRLYAGFKSWINHGEKIVQAGKSIKKHFNKMLFWRKS